MIEEIAISVKDLKSWRDQEKQMILIDVRETWERDIACLEDDIHIPLATFRDKMTEYPQDGNYVIYCHHGRRSLAAVMQMKEAGYQSVYNLEGGIAGWADEIDQNMPKY